MEYTYTTKAGTKLTYCDCECHCNADVMHFQACCDICGEQYIGGDGAVDHDKAAAICEKHDPVRVGKDAK